MSIAEKAMVISTHNKIIAENEQKVYEAGKKSAYDAFWDSYQDYGKRASYAYAFAGRGWMQETFKPKYQFGQIVNAIYMFASFGGTNGDLDLSQYMSELGLSFDLSKVNSSTHMFSEAYISHVPELNFTGHEILWVFMSNSNIKTIDKVILRSDGSTKFQAPFQDAKELENVVFEGVIGQNGFDVHWSAKLNKASHISIVNALSATTTGLTVTFSLTAVNKAFETSEGANDGSTSDEWKALIATKSNWTISLV